MKLTLCFIVLGFGLATPSANAQAVPDLIIQAGQVYQMPAQRWVFRNVEIGSNAKIIVSADSGEPFQLIIKGNLVLRGTIEARGWSSERRNIPLILPNGNQMTLSFSNFNRGGRGGDGGSIGSIRGGRGSVGTNEYGGGGGGGGSNATWHGAPGKVPGEDASENVGGRPGVSNCGASGATGPERSSYANGGVIYLQIAGTFDGTGGTLDVRGSPGEAGQPANKGFGISTNCAPGSGGASGGAPGGQGGVVVGTVSGSIVGYPTVLADGGAGGSAGVVGHGTGPATAGQSGKTGWVQWLDANGTGTFSNK